MSLKIANLPPCYGKRINIHPQSPCQRCSVMAPCAAAFNQRDDVLLKILIWPRIHDAPIASAVVIPDPRSLADDVLKPLETVLMESCGLRHISRSRVSGWGLKGHDAVITIREASHVRIVIAVKEHPPGRLAQLPVARLGVHLAPMLDEKRRKRHKLRDTPTRDEIKNWHRLCTVGTIATMCGITVATHFLEQVTKLWTAENLA